MTNAATWPLSPSTRVSRTVALVTVAIATLALIALAFAIGRWTVDTAMAPHSPALIAPAPGLGAPALDCRPHSYC